VTMLSMNLILIGCAIILGVFVIGRVCWTKKGRTFLAKNRFLVLLLSGLPFLNSVMNLLVIIQLVGRSDWVWVGVVSGLYVVCGIILGVVAVVHVSRGHNCFVVFICGFTGMSSLNSVWSLTATLRQANHETEKGQADIKQKLQELQSVVRLSFYYFQMPLAFTIAAYGLSYRAFVTGAEEGVFVANVLVAALNCACMFVGEIGRGNAYTTPENVFWEYQVGVLVFRLAEFTTRLFFIAMVACAYKWYAVGLLLLEVLLWTAIGASTESKTQRDMQSDNKKVPIKSLRDAKNAVRIKKFASAAGGGGAGVSAGGAGGMARCDQQFGSALAWSVAAVGLLPRELRDKLTDRAVDGSNPYMGAVTPLPYYLVRTLEIFIIASLYGNGVGFLPNDHLDPINGTCEDCREHDYAVIIWIVTQGVMICMVPLILVVSPKNSKYATSRCCYDGGGPRSMNEIELPQIGGVAATDNNNFSGGDMEGQPGSPMQRNIQSPGGGSPVRGSMSMGRGVGMGGASFYSPGLGSAGAGGMGVVGGSPYAFNAGAGGAISYTTGSGPTSFRQLSVASLAAQRFAAGNNSGAAYGVPSPRPRVSWPVLLSSCHSLRTRSTCGRWLALHASLRTCQLALVHPRLSRAFQQTQPWCPLCCSMLVLFLLT
jgi:hypothetical protein